MKKTVQVLIPMELYELLREHAEEEQRTLSGQIRQIIRIYFRQMGKKV